ncbi:hypothetical protein PL321_06315 [Caloramator sp. mosi_1]|uniref:hypothetical protein n=1 Tax=Caloramator sp. mosi_1 TaxID=3023090 RepID=UPI002362BDAE|nr:hypothetical protein [Caloramator sp. mosi_1]WDC85109.1 hypothetical protein PL321_06315 [Caloramator sp. mosi_1]
MKEFILRKHSRDKYLGLRNLRGEKVVFLKYYIYSIIIYISINIQKIEYKVIISLISI